MHVMDRDTICVGTVMWKDNDMGVLISRDIIIFNDNTPGTSHIEEYAIEGVLYGLSKEELLHELQNTEHTLRILQT